MSTLERSSYPHGTRVTLGITEIASAQRIIIVATGVAKSLAVKAMIEAKSGACPASLLRDIRSDAVPRPGSSEGPFITRKREFHVSSHNGSDL